MWVLGRVMPRHASSSNVFLTCLSAGMLWGPGTWLVGVAREERWPRLRLHKMVRPNAHHHLRLHRPGAHATNAGHTTTPPDAGIELEPLVEDDRGAEAALRPERRYQASGFGAAGARPSRLPLGLPSELSRRYQWSCQAQWWNQTHSTRRQSNTANSTESEELISYEQNLIYSDYRAEAGSHGSTGMAKNCSQWQGPES